MFGQFHVVAGSWYRAFASFNVEFFATIVGDLNSVWVGRVVLNILLVASVHLGSSVCVRLSSSSLYSHTKGSCVISIAADVFWYGWQEQHATLADVMQVLHRVLHGRNYTSPGFIWRFLMCLFWSYIPAFDPYHSWVFCRSANCSIVLQSVLQIVPVFYKKFVERSISQKFILLNKLFHQQNSVKPFESCVRNVFSGFFSKLPSNIQGNIIASI